MAEKMDAKWYCDIIRIRYHLCSTLILLAMGTFVPIASEAKELQAAEVSDCREQGFTSTEIEQIKHVISTALPNPPAPSMYEKGKVMAAKISLSVRGDTAVVYLDTDQFCGSGGCSSVVLHRESEKSRYKVVNTIFSTKLPMVALKSKHHGWRDLGVRQGAGMAQLTFNGARYPSNPSTAPQRPIEDNSEILIGVDKIGQSQCRIN